MWQDTGTGEKAVAAASYRTSMVCAAWTYPLIPAPAINAALSIGSLVGGARITRVEIFTPGQVPDEWVQRGYKKTDWGVRATWQKASSSGTAQLVAGTPEANLLGADDVVIIAGAIVAVMAAWAIVAKFTEKEVLELADDFNKGLAAVFNPGVIIAALAAIALFLRRR